MFISAYWVIFHALICRLLIFFKILSGIPSVSNSFDPDQARHFVKSDLGPNCLQRLSADNTSWQRVTVS